MPSVTDIRENTGSDPITMLAGYDARTARMIESAEIDIILVGDSVGKMVYGYETTIPVTVDDIARHTRAVTNVTENILVVADLPFLSYGVSKEQSVENAGVLIKEAGADAIKIECGDHTPELTEEFSELGISVMAHLGLTPQHMDQLSGLTPEAADESAAEHLVEISKRHEEAGAFAIVLEYVPKNVARQVTEAVDVPTIGIGAGGDTDGQVLIVDHVTGLASDVPFFAKKFGDAHQEMQRSINDFKSAVVSGEFPLAEFTPAPDDIGEIY